MSRFVGTLNRSVSLTRKVLCHHCHGRGFAVRSPPGQSAIPGRATGFAPRTRPFRRGLSRCGGARSEEHTSELQSRRDLVCRLLLEKKKRQDAHETLNKDNKRS